MAAVLCLAMGSLVTASSGPAVASPPHYPVPYTFLAGIAASPQGPDTPPPGANDWSCKPTATHPYPVVLVHGLLANETDNWQTFSPLLANHGYCVFSLTYGQDPQFTTKPMDEFGGLQGMRHSAKVLGRFVNRVLVATGASKVDLLGHSEGATMPNFYLKYLGGAAKVNAFVGLAPVVHGTQIAGPQLLTHMAGVFGASPSQQALLNPACTSCSQFAPDSTFIHQLDKGGVAVPGVRYTQIMTRYDELVVPYTSGEIHAPNATNIVVQNQCNLDHADHVALAADPVAARDVLNALAPAHAKPVPCVFVPPFTG